MDTTLTASSGTSTVAQYDPPDQFHSLLLDVQISAYSQPVLLLGIEGDGSDIAHSNPSLESTGNDPSENLYHLTEEKSCLTAPLNNLVISVSQANCGLRDEALSPYEKDKSI